MKKILIFLILVILIFLRFSLSTNNINFQKDGIYNMSLDLQEGKTNILKVNGKYPLKKRYARFFSREDAKYEGYFLVKDLYKDEDFCFLELEEIKVKMLKRNFFQKYLDEIFERSQENFSPDMKGVNKAFLLGDNSEISKDLKEKIIYLGLSHIFAMSGLHIGTIFSIFYFLSFQIFKNKLSIEISTLIFTTFYYLAVKESPSFTRAYIMLVICLLAKILYEKVNIEKTLIVSMIISILFKPNVIYSLSFQLSYLAMFSIIYIFPYTRKINFYKLKIIDYMLFTTTIQIFLIPIQIYYFTTFSFLAIIANVIILPFASLYILSNFIFLFLENFHIAFIFNKIIEFLYKIFIYLIDLFSKIPYASIENYNKKLVYVYFVVFVLILFKKIRNLYSK